ncbi:MAG: FIST C-terminal domain-containing protein [Desulfobacterales bacterium]|nr:FIST C-terminal domain-containing protein [Desulfobacterales bacterium]
MKIEQEKWTNTNGWEPEPPGRLGESAQLVLIFASTGLLKAPKLLDEIRMAYSKAHILGCSTAGEICGTQVTDDSLVSTAVSFEHTQLSGAQIKFDEVEDSFQAGVHLGQSLEKGELVHVFVLSDGIRVNGSALAKGLISQLPEEVTVTGGLSGDGERFQETLVLWDDVPEKDAIAVLGLYGKRLKVGYGSLGGWDPFGPERLITGSKGNVLYELDGKSALELYKKYLGEHAKGLPATGLLFPLSLRTKEGKTGVVRTILSVDEAEQSMTFAGDVPEGSYARLTKANFNRLVDGAVGAAKTSCETIGSSSPDLAILISCVGRRMVLKQRIEEEVEGVRDVLGDRTVLTGFYSYGEICPFTPGGKCELHNQTMTITTFSER